MSLFRVFDVAGSAMSAQSVRLNVTASNLANAESVSATPDAAYRARLDGRVPPLSAPSWGGARAGPSAAAPPARPTRRPP